MITFCSFLIPSLYLKSLQPTHLISLSSASFSCITLSLHPCLLVLLDLSWLSSLPLSLSSPLFSQSGLLQMPLDVLSLISTIKHFSSEVLMSSHVLNFIQYCWDISEVYESLPQFFFFSNILKTYTFSLTLLGKTHFPHEPDSKHCPISEAVK